VRQVGEQVLSPGHYLLDHVDGEDTQVSNQFGGLPYE
jgi:hypothetical protein